jgi:hypothetical protein
MRIYKGKIFFYDKEKGEGQVICEDDSIYYFYYDAISDLDRTEKDFWVSPTHLGKDNQKILMKYLSGMRVVFTLYENLYSKQIDTIWIC